jgi:hypothetical protein
MRLSLRERRTRDLVQCRVAGNPGRDDKKERAVARKGRPLKERAIAKGSTLPTTALSLGNGPLFATTLSFLSSRAYPDFLHHSSQQRHLCGSPQREPHAVDRSRNPRQEIRGSRGICGSADLSWKCFFPVFHLMGTSGGGGKFRFLSHSLLMLCGACCGESSSRSGMKISRPACGVIRV